VRPKWLKTPEAIAAAAKARAAAKKPRKEELTVLDDSAIVPVRPTREALHSLRDREATARLELEHVPPRPRGHGRVDAPRRRRRADHARHVLDLTHNRLAALRRAVGAYPPMEEDRAARVLRVADEIGADNVAAVARRAGASLSYTYRVLHDRPADAVAQAAMNGAKLRERLVAQQEEERAA
jgi:hypothetical protein